MHVYSVRAARRRIDVDVLGSRARDIVEVQNRIVSYSSGAPVQSAPSAVRKVAIRICGESPTVIEKMKIHIITRVGPERLHPEPVSRRGLKRGVAGLRNETVIVSYDQLTDVLTCDVGREATAVCSSTGHCRSCTSRCGE